MEALKKTFHKKKTYKFEFLIFKYIYKSIMENHRILF
jgi:hypothetical protein